MIAYKIQYDSLKSKYCPLSELLLGLRSGSGSHCNFGLFNENMQNLKFIF